MPKKNKILEALVVCEPKLSRTKLRIFRVPHETITMLAGLYNRRLVATVGWAKQETNHGSIAEGLKLSENTFDFDEAVKTK